MKNLLLGFSLGANIVLGYLVLEDRYDLDDIADRVDNLSDVAEGKAQQIKGALSGDTIDKIKGDLQSGKGNLKNKAQDVKDDIDSDLDNE
ncbi:CsbD family protein [Fructilactobacillus fructivorans]|uniref:CsbD family protein n=1 Tax=Fructilactobacillus fructivorans TaxID=1614 RepID=A0A0C1PP35_9LACO|nr:CsbD family protein [Fructilactobacillus fructivorans]KID41666.1 hypothetical protein LfDm3_0908 [Fructilactobacillus fructivorans]KRK57749.1 hypothetical protein FC73_GL000757 [Fructilactobacillus fructivorans]KRN12711.1 hypothetical protein IV37_GL001011 [Fructilactobacillus fructivorans]KRN40626.1 hypothetical protein IV51_GL001247 [Fructilactobacillus fructivorans]KRN43167.1 hypothetical protein IV48_GL000722 [Fructilactobacillus fructivorans]